MDADIEYCAQKLDKERMRADSAPCSEAAEMHKQMAMLYNAQLASLQRAKRAATAYLV